MVPAVYTFLEAMPPDPNGKVDRRALPAPDRASAAREYVAPRDEKEEFFCALWAELLSLERVGINDDFCELGGDSLLVIRVVTKANKAAMGITTKAVFQHRTIARGWPPSPAPSRSSTEQGPVTGPVGWTPAQLHFLDQTPPEPRLPHTSHAVRAEGRRLQFHLFQRGDGARHAPPRQPAGAGGGESASLSLFIDPPGAPVNLLRVDLSEVAEEQQMLVMSKAVRELVISCKCQKATCCVPLCSTSSRERFVFFTSPGQYMAADNQLLADCCSTTSTPPTGSSRRGRRSACRARPPRRSSGPSGWRRGAKPGGMPQQELDYWLAQAPINPPRFPMDHEKGPNDWISARFSSAEFDLEETQILLQQVQRFLGVQIDAVLVTAV